MVRSGLDPEFLDLDAEQMGGFAQTRAAALGLAFAPAHLNGVVENLLALQAHVRNLAAQGPASTLDDAS